MFVQNVEESSNWQFYCSKWIQIKKFESYSYKSVCVRACLYANMRGPVFPHARVYPWACETEYVYSCHGTAIQRSKAMLWDYKVYGFWQDVLSDYICDVWKFRNVRTNSFPWTWLACLCVCACACQFCIFVSWPNFLILSTVSFCFLSPNSIFLL